MLFTHLAHLLLYTFCSRCILIVRSEISECYLFVSFFQSGIESKMQAAQDWLADPRALKGGVGEKSLRQILDHALRIADRCLPADRDAIRKAVADISNMVDSLSELRAEGKGTSPQAEALARGIGQRLNELSRACARGIQNAERSGIQQPAHTILGKLDQAKRWLNAPWVDDKGLGKRKVTC